MADDILATLELTPDGVPGLPAKVRNTLINYLIRWGHYDAAHRCLQQLLFTHSHLLSVYDKLAHVHLAQGQPERALQIMQRREALKSSTMSQELIAEVHLAAGDLSSAQAIADKLLAQHPHMLKTWRLRLDICLASGDTEGAEAALRQVENLRPEAAASAMGFVRLWQSQGDTEKAILWARTALARSQREERQPAVELLCLLETLYRAAGQPAQAQATAAQLQERRRRELEELQQALNTPATPPPGPPAPQPIAEAAIAPGAWPAIEPPVPPPVLTGAVDLTPDERGRLDQALHRRFAHETFRPGQADVIAANLRGESVLAVMPTGAGKSLCYQLASLLLPGITLVISPLIALMKDQVDGLPTSVARQATTLNHTLSSAELDARLARAAGGGYRLLYAAPERLRQRPFLHALRRAGVSLLVVDEAHCVSLWGHDFRPDYLFIANAWQELGKPPILAMTATATPRVRDDIQAALGQMRLVTTDVHRPNLRLEARRFAKKAQKTQALLALCRELEGSGIVYARARLQCEELAAALCRSGLSAMHYHAGIPDRDASQDRFMESQARIVVATIAFGMGVDKADVRFIIHYDPPKTLENYYQEAGRAGRDGLPAHCILFHTPGDKAKLSSFNRQDALRPDFLRAVYACLERRLGSEGVGLVALADLERDLVADETPIRVAVHFLETAGLVWRGFDLPRTASLALLRAPDGDEEEFARFVEAARLLPRQTVSRDMIALSREAGIDPRTVESQLLAWVDAGWLRYRGIGRDMLLSLPEPPADSRQRVAAMLADYRAGQDGRLAEITGYASTHRCRHGHISAYFGGRTIDRCQACDNCLTQARPIAPQKRTARPAPKPSRAHPPQQPTVGGDPRRYVLEGVSQLPFPLGRSGLARALQGARTSPVKAGRFPYHGTLASWTQRGIGEFIAQLEEQGFLEPYRDRGYRLLRLTDKGQAWLEASPEVQSATPVPTQPPPDSPAEVDENLFARLRAWQLQVAKESNLPPFFVLPQDTLRQIAAQRPATPSELLAIKGIGLAKLEQYGTAILDIVASQKDNG